MSGSCHLDRALNVKVGVECQIFFIVIFFNCDWVLQFGANSRYYKGALTKKGSFVWFVLLPDMILMSTEKIKTNIQHYIRHATLCPNDMNQTLVHMTTYNFIFDSNMIIIPKT